MHELSIARALISLAERHLPPRTRAARLHVVVGSASGIVPEALELAFRAASQATAFDGARLEIERKTSPGRCTGCGASFALDGLLGACPACGTWGGELLGAEELELKSLEVVDV